MVALMLCTLSSAGLAEEGTDTVDSPPLSSTADTKEPTPAEAKDEKHDGAFFYNPFNVQNWNAAFQATYIWQYKPSFKADYSGPHSLLTKSESGYTLTATVALGYRPWIGAELFVNPEIIQSMEISNLHGLGGLPNGENQKSGGPLPKMYVARLFFRQTFNVGGDFSLIESTANQFGKRIAARRFVLTLGVLAVTDIFDLNTFSHDPRTQFINWALWTYGTTDYAADSRGYTWGIVLEYYHDDWVFRIGRFAQPTRSNGMTIDFNIIAHYGDYFEIEHDHTIRGQGGKIRMIGFNNHARMGNFQDALTYARVNGGTPDVAKVRRGQSKYGMGINIEQSITQDAGVFVRFSFNDGQTETYAYAADRGPVNFLGCRFHVEY
jgi:high affinity Mn2+ porin